jgi:arylsulfatase A-like enzyme
MPLKVLTACLALTVLLTSAVRADDAARPNVVLVMTDDQGYGDLRCLGNTVIQTPTLDGLHKQSVRLTDFHVDPTCSPTRAALMTGRYSSRTGVWHTIMGRSIMHAAEITLADIFSVGGYRTGIFGKWHLGDNFPYLPQYRGFHETLIHGGGGITQTPDFWGNTYFDDTFLHNGTPQEFTGYCTDVFFTAALDFIETNKDRPFFAYIPTNAPHGPFLVDEKYSRPYKEQGVPSPTAEFWGMITNIDDNMARLLAKLEELGLEENTILIFMTDNGTAAGYRRQGGKTIGFNAGMRGTKGSHYDGGHRVPCFIRWPGKLEGGRDIDKLTAHIDLLPTLAELCNLKTPDHVKFDGKSLVPLLKDSGDWPERTLFVHSQRVEWPEKWRQCAVMTERWRLINGEELYDIGADPGQQKNVAADHAQVVANLRTAYETWWGDTSTRFDEYVRLPLGAPEANPTELTCHDWHAPQAQIPWNQQQVSRSPEANGYWAVEVVRDGKYEFTLRARPAGVDWELPAGTAKVQIGEAVVSGPIAAGMSEVKLTLDLKAGPAKMQTWLDETDGASRGAFFVSVRFVE